MKENKEVISDPIVCTSKKSFINSQEPISCGKEGLAIASPTLVLSFYEFIFILQQ